MKENMKKGRPRSFDEESILEKSMAAFWRYGFSATNYEVLEAATELRRQSLVYAFGDKRTLFLKSLSHYFETRVAEVVRLLEGDGSDIDNIREVFKIWLASAKDEAKRGCLIVNTSGQFGASDEDVAAIVNKAVATLRDAFAKAYQSAQASGEAISSVSAVDLARVTVAAGNGALLHVHSDEDPENTIHVLNSLLAMITTTSASKSI